VQWEVSSIPRFPVFFWIDATPLLFLCSSILGRHLLSAPAKSSMLCST
jgi:hypothetical protein